MLAGTAQAQDTTANLRVVVTDQDGTNLAGVGVRVVHVPTGRSLTLTSNAAGVATARGLAVGGPYEVTIAASNRYAADVQQNIYLDLDQTELIALSVRPVIEEVIVTAQAITQEMAIGIGRSFDRAKIDATPSVSRNFVDTLATDPHIMVDNSVGRGPGVSMAGQNFRFNSVTIDGVAQNDNFGLNKGASATSRAPISIDAIEAITVNMAPYDVTYGNFVGGNINIVTKSGTNEFHGSAFYLKMDDGSSGDESDGEQLSIGDFEEDTYGFSLGGPIIKDKLFFFTNYEKFETTRPSNAQTIGNIAGVDQADVDRVRSVMQSVYGFDPGPFATSEGDEDEKILVKLDWYINDDHRAVAAYQVADGDALFDDFPETAVLQSNRYNINQKLTSTSFHLFSNWTDNFSTELKLGTKEVVRRDISVDGSVPDFAIFAPGGGTITAGGDRFRHSNELDNDTDIFRLKGDLQLGDHLLTAGFDQESKTVRNRFLPWSHGQYFFFSIDDLETQTSSLVAYGNSNTGVAEDAEARFTLDVNTFYVQDEWAPTDDLTLTFGFRFDELKNDDPITDNTDFFDRNQFTNGENLDGKDLVSPRFGFNWTANDRLTIRGGAGLFGGGSPLIILSNAYAGDGISRTFVDFIELGTGRTAACEQAVLDAVAALPDPNAAFEFMQVGCNIGVNPLGQTDAIDPSYEMLSTWKYSLGADYLADLSFMGMGDEWLFSADVILSEVEDGYDIHEATRTQTPISAPDGRPIYDIPAAGGDFIVRNTGLGSGTVVTLSLAKTFDTNAGVFDLNLGYTYQDVDELKSYNRFVAYETFGFDPQTDLNNPLVAPSKYEVENRITAQLTWQKELFGENMSTVGLVYAGRSGRHFSYVFRHSAPTGFLPFGGHFLPDADTADNPGSQLFYVPTGTSDPLVTGDPAFLADLDEYIDTTDCLSDYRGTNTPRNGCSTSWTNVFDVRLMQEVSIGGSMKFDIMLDIMNFGNLLNSDWGRVDSYAAPSNVAPAAVDIVAGQFVLTPNASYDPSVGASTIVPRPTIAALPSVYRIQLGVRFRF
jgi:outer membrane receptor for ferrienterochelin and colicin